MKITLSEKVVSEEVEIPTPSYFKDSTWHYKIEDHKITSVNKSHCGIWRKDRPYSFFESTVKEAIKATPCTSFEFNSVLQEFLKELTGDIEQPEEEHQSIGNDLTHIDD